MADMRKVMRGLEILYEHRQPDNPPEVLAEHDELFATGEPPANLSPEAVAELKELGWFYDASFSSWKRFT